MYVTYIYTHTYTHTHTHTHTPYSLTFLNHFEPHLWPNMFEHALVSTCYFSKCLAAVHVLQLLHYNFVWNLTVLKLHPSATYMYSLCLITLHYAVQNALVFPVLHGIRLQPAFHHVCWCGGDPRDGSCETTA